MSTQKKPTTSRAPVMARWIDRYGEITRDVYGAYHGFQRGLAVFLMWVLSAYIVFTQYTGHSRLFSSPLDTVCVLLFTVLYTVLAYQGLKLVFHAMKRSRMTVKSERGRLPVGLFIGVFVGVLAYLLVYWIAYYPGGISLDNVDQWRQAVEDRFNSWHPVVHTLTIWLATQIHESYPFVILLQMLVFSIGIAYLSATLAAWGFRKLWLAFILVLVVTNLNTVSVLDFAYCVDRIVD